MASMDDDRMAQAKRDLEHAVRDIEGGYHEHACFGAQQAAGKAVEAVYQYRHAEAWGHSVSRLLLGVPSVGLEADATLVNDARILDQYQYHVPTRYPDGFESGAPMDYHTGEQARDAVARAGRIVAWCDGLPRGPQAEDP